MTPGQYHDGTKHHFHQFARSLGYLDWAAQPSPFRSFAGAPVVPLHPAPGGHGVDIGDLLRHSLGLSAWKQHGRSRWALRVNPSSGNLHPTEAYIVAGPAARLAPSAGVYHYAPDRHVLEQRAAVSADVWRSACLHPDATFLVALTSIHWREAWKYGERAFRYCQHDLGHAVAAVRLAASLRGWQAVMLPDWSQREIAALTGIDRDEDYVEAEREEAGCLIAVTSRRSSVVSHESPVVSHPSPVVHRCLVDAVRSGHWSGKASQLSQDHVEWTFIDEIARATEDPGRGGAIVPPSSSSRESRYARAVILQRRSALSFDGRTSMPRDSFIRMLERTMPGEGAPLDALWWTPRIHLALFVHRVEGLAPGLYLLPRDGSAVDRLKAALGRDFLWETADDRVGLVCLMRGDYRRTAQRLSCDQDIAADGFFSLGMLADFDASLREHGPSFYRHLFWESGSVGQVLYLEAEEAGARATGIGCFYDDAVHEVLGLTDHAFQSVYHFTVGMPVEDPRLGSEPGYAWEAERACSAID